MICNKCKEDKPLSLFYKRSADTHRKICKKCTNAQHRKWYKETTPKRVLYAQNVYRANKEKIIKQKVNGNLKRRHLAKQECISHYSHGRNCCECCGEDRIEFLAIDHIKGNGGKHRKSIKEYLPVYLKKNNFPEGFRILCHNCNMSLGFFGYCPHEKEREKVA